MGSWKNIIENIILIAVIFLGLGIYTSMVLKPILIESIRQETTKIENNIDSKISNKFKKIDELNSNLSTMFPIENTQDLKPNIQNTTPIGCEPGKVCIDIDHLTSRQKKRLGLK